MESETQRMIQKESYYNLNLNSNSKYFSIRKIVVILIIIIALFIIIIICVTKTIQLKEEKRQNEKNITNNINITMTELNTKKNTSKELEEITYVEFNEDILNTYKKQQNEFCINENKYNNSEYEKKIKQVDVDYLGKKFKMYVYNSEDIISNAISKYKSWERGETLKLIKALHFFSTQKNISKENIYVLDIGSNIGWYTFYLGKCGYKVLSFEPSELNMYILRKNFCLNRELNVTLIKKGLYTEEKICDFYISKGNVGDGWIFCDKNASISNNLIKSGKTILTRLSNYISYLITNNLALIKIDVEGSEEKALLSGVELITKYKVPFIFLEFTPSALENHGTNSTEFLTLFEKNGYKFSNNYFLDSQYLSIDDIIKGYTIAVNLYIVHSSILNSNKE